MMEIYSTQTLFCCTLPLQRMKEDSDPKEMCKNRLKQSLSLLSLLLNHLAKSAQTTDDFKSYLKNFSQIMGYKGGKVSSQISWSPDEFILLLIMMRAYTWKRYSEMKKSLASYLKDEKAIPSAKTIQNNREWLRNALDVIFALFHNDWHKSIDLSELLMINESANDKADEMLQTIHDEIQQSRILESDAESVHAQILMRCAYPELLNMAPESTAEKLSNQFGTLVEELVKVYGNAQMTMAANETIKKLQMAIDEIQLTYQIDPVYTKEFWGHLDDPVGRAVKKSKGSQKSFTEIIRTNLFSELGIIDQSTV
ncbi:hypothetical protein NIE88_09765 [Sporolactobacillus shoreicorticis]|uniref:Uncharacterized protein n=1 Tax=Sporolactobacillus shoreicorticis TaxID=1923877 RepID=A0ABW5S990_9BACL|nr:hypothetical protein [Sporolactobacillus shoreicorticis]MCO7126062.1 hypothetical protein [Sporolactobacillus shoreicorticis]